MKACIIFLDGLIWRKFYYIDNIAGRGRGRGRGEGEGENLILMVTDLSLDKSLYIIVFC